MLDVKTKLSVVYGHTSKTYLEMMQYLLSLMKWSATVSLFVSGKLPPDLELKNSTAKLYHYLKVSEPHSIFSKLVQSYISLTPHSIGPERAVSVHTILKSDKQSNYSREALNSRMIIALNGKGTAHYDPRPAVIEFLERKERRQKLPDNELYKDQEYIKKFFSKD